MAPTYVVPGLLFLTTGTLFIFWKFSVRKERLASLNGLILEFSALCDFSEKYFWKKLQKFWVFMISVQKKLFSSLDGTFSGSVWHYMIIEKFPNSCPLNISNTLLFLNLERGAYLYHSRLVVSKLCRYSLLQIYEQIWE